MRYDTYKGRNFGDEALDVIQVCHRIITEYEQDGYDLTLRQLYYQLVARGHIENTERSYKRVGQLVSDGRLAGLLPWDQIVDRTRNLKKLSHWDSPGQIVMSAVNQYRVDTWQGQDFYVEVWVEKEALAGVVERVANDLDVPFFCCRGYVSQSEMWAAAQRFVSLQGRDPVIIHLGDHDPSGIDMTRDIVDRLEMFCGRSIEVRRIALNIDQIEDFNPPPNPAKVTDSRARGYIAEFGKKSWELDALEPRVLNDLIREAISRYLDARMRERVIQEQEKQRAILRRTAENLLDDYDSSL